MRFTRIVTAEAPWTHLCDVEAGRRYEFKARGTWIDWFIDTDADGYDRFWLRPFAHRRRAPREKWFALIGTINQDETTAFLIGSEKSWVAPVTGSLWCFANDMPTRYGNNKGAIEVTGVAL